VGRRGGEQGLQTGSRTESVLGRFRACEARMRRQASGTHSETGLVGRATGGSGRHWRAGARGRRASDLEAVDLDQHLGGLYLHPIGQLGARPRHVRPQSRRPGAPKSLHPPVGDDRSSVVLNSFFLLFSNLYFWRRAEEKADLELIQKVSTRRAHKHLSRPPPGGGGGEEEEEEEEFFNHYKNDLKRHARGREI